MSGPICWPVAASHCRTSPAAAGEEDLAIGAERHAYHSRRMQHALTDGPAGVDLPEPCRLVLAPGENCPAIGAECDGRAPRRNAPSVGRWAGRCRPPKTAPSLAARGEDRPAFGLKATDEMTCSWGKMPFSSGTWPRQIERLARAVRSRPGPPPRSPSAATRRSRSSPRRSGPARRRLRPRSRSSIASRRLDSDSAAL